MTISPVFWPHTLKEFCAQADIVDCTKAPYSVSRYSSIDEAYRVGAETGETVLRDDWDLRDLPDLEEIAKALRGV